MSLKKLGIIGGMGPLADETFIFLLHICANAKTDQDYIPFILDGNCSRPDRSAFLCKKSSESPFESLKSSTKMLVESGCDAIVMPCNTAHFWYEELKEIVPNEIYFPSMIELSLENCAKKCYEVMLLSTDGTRLCGIYSTLAPKFGIKITHPPKHLAVMTSQLIASVKSGKNSNIAPLLTECKKYCKNVILGCTELSRAYLNTKQSFGLCITDSLQILAQCIVSKFEKYSNL